MNALSCPSGCVHTAGAAHRRWCSTPASTTLQLKIPAAAGALHPQQAGALTGRPNTTWHLLNVAAGFCHTSAKPPAVTAVDGPSAAQPGWFLSSAVSWGTAGASEAAPCSQMFLGAPGAPGALGGGAEASWLRLDDLGLEGPANEV